MHVLLCCGVYYCVSGVKCVINVCLSLCANVRLSIRHTHSQPQLTPLLYIKINEFQKVCHILPGAISHHCDIVTLWQNNLAVVSLKLHKVPYTLPINYSSRGAYVAAWSCEVSSSSGLCMEAIPRGMYTSNTSQSKPVSTVLRGQLLKALREEVLHCVSTGKCTSICCLTCIEWSVCECACVVVSFRSRAWPRRLKPY